MSANLAVQSSVMPKTHPGVLVIKPGDRFTDQDHGFPRFWGISDLACGATTISMAEGAVAPGTEGTLHDHRYETAIFVKSGQVLVPFRVGGGPLQKVEAFAGDFIHILPGVFHAPVNLGKVPMIYVVARPTGVAD